MKYNYNWLINEIANGKKFEYFGFWGSKSESLVERSFSNFFKADMEVEIYNGKLHKFSCNEQYFMYRKALTFKDFDILEEILKPNKRPQEYKDLGRKVKNFDNKLWDSIRYDVMLDGLRLKFSQNYSLKKSLLYTGNKVLVEVSPFDDIFGVKLSKVNRDGSPNNLWKNPKNWKGRNLLGFALMEVRDELRET